MPGILALDISSRTGFAYGTPESQAPITGVWRLPRIDLRETQASAYGALLRNLVKLNQQHKFDGFAFEAPLPTHAHTKGDTQKSAALSESLLGLAAVADAFAACFNIPARRWNVQTVRARFCGHGRPEDGKGAVLAACARLRWPVIDDNAADAAAVWWCAMKEAHPGTFLADPRGLFGAASERDK